MNDNEYAYMKGKVRELLTIDLESYKEQQMRRRLGAFMKRYHTSDVESYLTAVEKDHEMLRELKDFLTINVSEFFRDERQFRKLENEILPELLRSSSRLNVWSAGCSNGSEPYTIAIILAEISPGCHHRILATDIDGTILARAQAGGPYSAQDVKNVRPELLSKYFNKVGNEHWVVDRIRERVGFKPHNLLSSPYEYGFDLIVCRNVVIYFTDQAKQKINARFHKSLKSTGILFVGGSEIIFNAAEIGFESISPSFYRKIDKYDAVKRPVGMRPLSMDAGAQK